MPRPDGESSMNPRLWNVAVLHSSSCRPVRFIIGFLPPSLSSLSLSTSLYSRLRDHRGHSFTTNLPRSDIHAVEDLALNPRHHGWHEDPPISRPWRPRRSRGCCSSPRRPCLGHTVRTTAPLWPGLWAPTRAPSDTVAWRRAACGCCRWLATLDDCGHGFVPWADGPD